MNPVLRGLAIYFVLLLMFRILGKRNLSETTTFDFLLLLIIGEVTQQALLGDDYSLTNAFLLIGSLIGIDLVLSLTKRNWKIFDAVMEGAPLLIVNDGKPIAKRLKKTKVEEADVLEAARDKHGLERMDQIKYAVLEKNGSISIIPY